ncbi:unnamed protein product, partial [Rotaria magnacalcarata]
MSSTRTPIDMYISIIQQRPSNNSQPQPQQQTTNDGTSSISIDQWIENRISTSNDHRYSRQLKTKRLHPPPLK